MLFVLLRSGVESSQYQRIHLVMAGGLPRGLPHGTAKAVQPLTPSSTLRSPCWVTAYM